MVAPWRSWDLPVVQAAAWRFGWLERLGEDHGPGMRRMLRRMLGNEDDALDAYQACLCQLARRSTEVPLRRAAGYAYRTAANLALETIRRRRRRAAHWPRVVADVRSRHALDRDDALRVNEQPASGLPTDVRRAVHTLPRHLREVIVLRDLGQLPYSQVGRILDIRPTTARVYRRQAIVRLQRMLAGAPSSPPANPANPSPSLDRVSTG